MRITEMTIDFWGIFITALIIWCWVTGRIEMWVALIFLLSRLSAKLSLKWPSKSTK